MPQNFTKSSDVLLKPIDFHDFHFRINYKSERKLKTNRQEIISLLQNWKDTKKFLDILKDLFFHYRVII